MDEGLSVVRTGEISALKQQCADLQAQLSELQDNYNHAITELESAKRDLQKKSDLCTMYEHILDERGDQLDEITERCNSMARKEDSDYEKILNLQCTIDVMATRIAELMRW